MSTTFELSADFIADMGINLDEEDIEFGLERGYLKPGEAASVKQLRQSRQNEASRISAELESPGRDGQTTTGPGSIEAAPHSSVRKWLFLQLKAAYLCRADLADPLGVVEEIYADFDYPASMDGFVRYMPHSSGGEASPAGVMDRWRRFLEKEECQLATGSAIC